MCTFFLFKFKHTHTFTQIQTHTLSNCLLLFYFFWPFFVSKQNITQQKQANTNIGCAKKKRSACVNAAGMQSTIKTQPTQQTKNQQKIKKNRIIHTRIYAFKKKYKTQIEI